MRIGQLRHRITVQQKAVTQNSFGEAVASYTELATVWASIESIAGREYFEARQAPAAEVTTRIRIRHRDDITPEMRAVCGKRTFEIVSVLDPDGRKREMILMCREVMR